MSSLSQEESRSISENTAWGKRKRFAEGDFSLAYSTFLGYDKGENGKLVINEDQAKTVRLIYNLFLSGSSCYKIKQTLEARHLLSPTGRKTWHQSTIRNILVNEKYAGDALLQKYYTSDFLTKKRKVNNGELQQYMVTDDHEAIISRSMFDAVKAKITCKETNQSLITKKLVCGKCGEHMGRKLWHSTDKYRCIVYKCDCNYIKETTVKDEFVKAVNEYLKNSGELVKVLKIELEKISDVSQYKNKLIELEDEKISVTNELNKIDEIYMRTGKDNNKRFDLATRLGEIDQEKLVVSEKISSIENRKITILQKIKILGCGAVTEFSEELWEILLERVVYDGDLKWEWKS